MASIQPLELTADRVAEISENEDTRVFDIENKLLQGIFGCRSPEAVEASVMYARFLSSVGITPENYPVFLRMLEIENHWVIDALIGERDSLTLLSSVQPNRFIVGRILAMMTRWHRGAVYHKNLSVILGVLQSVYGSPRDGYRIYPVTIADVNAVGKHLNKAKGQNDPVNRAILAVLEKFSMLEDSSDPDVEEIAIHATAVRNAFFDDRKRMEDVIPPVLLVMVTEHDEVSPRRYVKTSKSSGSSTGKQHRR